MDVSRLITMANDIAAFFDNEAGPQAAADGVRNHLRKYWEPRMRRELVAHVKEGGGGLSPTARAAVEGLEART